MNTELTMHLHYIRSYTQLYGLLDIKDVIMLIILTCLLNLHT